MKKKNAYILGGSALLGFGLYMFGKGTLKQKLAEAVSSGDSQEVKKIVTKTHKPFLDSAKMSQHIDENYQIITDAEGNQVAVPVASVDYWQENIEGYEPSVWASVKEALGTVFGKIAGR